MTSLRPETATRPEEHSPVETARSQETAGTERRIVQLEVLADPGPERLGKPTGKPKPPSSVSGTPARRVPVTGDDWLRLAELVVGDWTSTLREALVRVVWFTCVLIALGVAFGVEVALVGATAGVMSFLVNRRRSSSDD